MQQHSSRISIFVAHQPAGPAGPRHDGNEFLPGRSGADGSSRSCICPRRCSATSSRILIGSADWPAAISTNARGWPTATRRCCTSATSSAATSRRIEYHPAYREIEKAAFGEFGIHALSIRKGIMGWPDKYPVVAKHAFTFLFNQTEFGMGCPINVTDGCAKLLTNFGSEALKAKYLDGLTQTDMSRADAGRPVHDREGRRLRRRHADHTRGAGGRPLAALRREMVLLERRCQGGDAAGAAWRAQGRARKASACS